MALFATMTGLKIYFAISIALGLVCVVIYELLHVTVALIRKRNITEVISECLFWVVQTATFALLALIIFLPTNKGSGGVYVVLSTWPKLLISPEKMNWNIWWLRMQVYEEAENLKAIVVYQILVNLVFFITFYAWKGFGVFALLLKNYRSSNVMVSFSFFQIAALVFLGMHTLQTSGGHNTFNFTIVALSWLTFLTAGVYSWVWQKVPRFIGVFLTIIIVVMTVPRVFALTHEFVVGTWTQKKSVLITHAELQALSYIEAHAPLDFVIQADGRNALNFETPYIYALSGRRTYLGGTLILESHNQPIAERKKLVNDLFSPLAPSILDQNVSEEGIDLLYIKKKEELTSYITLEKITHDTHLLLKFFENEEIVIYTPTVEIQRAQYEWCGGKKL